MSKKWLKVALMVTAIATGTSIQVDAETVLYVPQDDRPVSLQYTVEYRYLNLWRPCGFS